MTANREMQDDARCDICNSTFQRREHYQRHIRTHTKEKPFTCSDCKQSFSRVDSLARHHSAIHSADRQTNNDRQNDRRRVAQACKSCSISKVRCDGDRPCYRCREHDTQCIYESSSKRRTAGHGASDKAPAKRPKNGHQTPSSPPVTIHETSSYMAAPVDAVMPPAPSSNVDQPPPSPPVTIREGVMAPPPLSVATYTPLGSDQNVSPDMAGGQVEQHPPMETLAAPTILTRESLATPSFSTGDSFNLESWFGYDLEMNNLLPSITYDPEPAYEAFHDIFLDSIEPEQHSSTPLTSPPAVTVLEPSAVAELYSRSHSPAIDEDADGPRQYHPTSIEVDAQLVFPDLSELSLEDVVDQEDLAHVEEVPPRVGETVLKHAMELQRGPSYPRFVELRVPPVLVLNAWVQLYFEAFHPVFPFLHRPSFGASKTHWLLIFAVAAIGAQFSGVKHAQACSRAMHELVRRQTSTMCEQRNQNGRELWMVQTIVLNQLGLMYSGERRALEIAEIYQALPVTLGRRKRLFISTLSAEKISQLPLAQKWQLWVLDEERGRAGFSVWLLDCAFEDHFDLTPLMTPAELCIPLPQAEERWGASNVQSWISFGSTPGFGSGFTLEQVIADDKWKTAWSKTNTTGKQVMLQHFTSIVKRHSSTTHPGIPNFSEQDRLNAADTLTKLLAMSEKESSEQSISDIKATLVHQIMALAALMIHNVPTRNFTTIAVKFIHSRIEQEPWLRMAKQWREASERGKLATFYAARILHVVRCSRCAHFATPVSLFRAVLVLWIYSKLQDPPSSQFPSPQSPTVVVLGPKPLEEMRNTDWGGESEWSRVKLPGIGNILCTQGRCKLLDEGITMMKANKVWGISATYAQLLARLRACERPPTTSGSI